jgi:hypothetical protein
MPMKNSDTIGNRTCDFTARSAVSQPTVPPRIQYEQNIKQTLKFKNINFYGVGYKRNVVEN